MGYGFLVESSQVHSRMNGTRYQLGMCQLQVPRQPSGRVASWWTLGRAGLGGGEIPAACRLGWWQVLLLSVFPRLSETVCGTVWVGGAARSSANPDLSSSNGRAGVCAMVALLEVNALAGGFGDGRCGFVQSRQGANRTESTHEVQSAAPRLDIMPRTMSLCPTGLVFLGWRQWNFTATGDDVTVQSMHAHSYVDNM